MLCGLPALLLLLLPGVLAAAAGPVPPAGDRVTALPHLEAPLCFRSFAGAPFPSLATLFGDLKCTLNCEEGYPMGVASLPSKGPRTHI